MGLDIISYRNLSRVENPKFDRDKELLDREPGMLHPGRAATWSESVWPGRAEGLDVSDRRIVYRSEEFQTFHVGSFKGYGEWRISLASMVGYTAGKYDKSRVIAPGPFRELIHFSDYEGTIGPVVSAKLASDFVEYADDAADFAHKISSDWYLDRYCDWLTAFEMASDRGAVQLVGSNDGGLVLGHMQKR